MNGIDFLLISLVIVGAFCLYIHRLREDERQYRDHDRAARRRHIIAELEDVPLDWVDDLDDIHRLPETFA